MTNQNSDRDRFVAVLATNAKLFEDGNIYAEMLQAFCDRLLESRTFMRLVGCRHEYQRKHFLDTLGQQYSGIVFLSTIYRYDEFIRATIANFEGPMVLLDHFIESLPVSSVLDDSAAGMKKATEHLLQLGHRSLAYLDMYRSADNPWKREGICTALREAGLPELEVGRTAACHNEFEDALVALDWFMELDSPPTAIICFDDDRALFMLRAAAERGLNVPGDISVLGYGDTAFRKGKSGILTSLDTDAPGQGRMTADLVTGAMPNEARKFLVEPKLVVRGSTAPPPKG